MVMKILKNILYPNIVDDKGVCLLCSKNKVRILDAVLQKKCKTVGKG